MNVIKLRTFMGYIFNSLILCINSIVFILLHLSTEVMTTWEENYLTNLQTLNSLRQVHNNFHKLIRYNNIL